MVSICGKREEEEGGREGEGEGGWRGREKREGGEEGVWRRKEGEGEEGEGGMWREGSRLKSRIYNYN